MMARYNLSDKYIYIIIILHILVIKLPINLNAISMREKNGSFGIFVAFVEDLLSKSMR